MSVKKNRIIMLLTLAMFVGVANVHAVDLWYDFEGDLGRVATDKLTDDGAQDGDFLGIVGTQASPGTVPWGTQSALFQIPGQESATIEVPGSNMLGETYTLAMHANNLEDTLGFTRLFSSYGGIGAIASDRVLFDYDPSGATLENGIRAIVNSVSITPTTMPAGIADPGYHHYALTVDTGIVSIYFDGVEIASQDVGLGYSNTGAPIYIGEDANDLVTDIISEQFIGNVDDILVTDQALSATQIASLASGSSVQSVLTSPSTSYAVNYDFADGTLADKLTLDGVQDGILNGASGIDTEPANAKLGDNSAILEDFEPFTQINTGITGTDLGDAFTMSAVINVDGDGYPDGKLTRLFSTYGGSGSAAGRLIFDFDPDGSQYDFTARIILPGGDSVKSTSESAFSLSENHTLTGVYDGSTIKLYIDGVEVASEAASGTVDLGEWELLVGEDVTGLLNEQFLGTMDDVLILGRALSATEVATLHASGAEALLVVNEDAPGDANKDGKVDGSDVTILAGNWQAGVGDPNPETVTWEMGDFNGDGQVDGSDVTILAGNWQYGVTAATASVPEPGTIALLLTAISSLLVWRRLR